MAVELIADPDIVYVRRRNTTVFRSREGHNDSMVVFDLDKAGIIVGVQVLLPDNIRWKDHPDRQDIPSDLLAELDLWFEPKENSR
jgi:hypothetical protein